MGINSFVAAIDFLPTSDVDRAGVLTLVGAVLTSENSFELQIQTQLWLKVSICLGSACFLSSQCRYAFSPTDENINRKLREMFLIFMQNSFTTVLRPKTWHTTQRTLFEIESPLSVQQSDWDVSRRHRGHWCHLPGSYPAPRWHLTDMFEHVLENSYPQSGLSGRRISAVRG